MHDPIRRLRLVILLLLLLLLSGTAGYILIEHMSLLDAAYMTVITLTTVGYREVKGLSPVGKLFTMGLLLVGVSVLAWALQSVVESVVSDQLTQGVWRRRMNRAIARMKDHYIVCGHGRMGQQITQELHRQQLPFVVIEVNEEQIPLLESLGYPFLLGNAADDAVLLAAGIERARGLVAVGPTDAENIFITLSARGLNPSVYIVARSVLQEDEEKLRRAGANKVLSPYIIGGRRMAVALLRPAVADFLDFLAYAEPLDLAMVEIPVAPGASLAGQSLAESGLFSTAGPMVVGWKGRDGAMNPAPPDTWAPHAGDTLIVVGAKPQVEALRAAAAGKHVAVPIA